MDAQVERPVTQENVQVVAKPRRRTYTAEYKRRILKEADAGTTPGTVGALLRREGLDSALLGGGGRARRRRGPAAPAPEKACRPPTPVDPPRRKDTQPRAPPRPATR